MPQPNHQPETHQVIPKSLTIHSVAEIDALLALIKQAWHPDPDRFDGGLATFAPSSGTI
ncbi:23085_t:CDS:2 [Rhizophagus irregularis]|nr:23085_t:CDS:2 [Rhizophagus irregularis]